MRRTLLVLAVGALVLTGGVFASGMLVEAAVAPEDTVDGDVIRIQQQMLQLRKQLVDKMVDAGEITEEEAQEIKAEWQSKWDSYVEEYQTTGKARFGQGSGCFGRGSQGRWGSNNSRWNKGRPSQGFGGCWKTGR